MLYYITSPFEVNLLLFLDKYFDSLNNLNIFLNHIFIYIFIKLNSFIITHQYICNISTVYIILNVAILYILIIYINN